jgi:hypothetical protein
VIYAPETSEYGYYLTATNATCCGQQFVVYSPAGNCESPGSAMNPSLQKKLDEWASMEPLLIANCAGQFHPYLVASEIRTEKIQKALDLPPITFSW